MWNTHTSYMTKGISNLFTMQKNFFAQGNAVGLYVTLTGGGNVVEF